MLMVYYDIMFQLPYHINTIIIQSGLYHRPKSMVTKGPETEILNMGKLLMHRPIYMIHYIKTETVDTLKLAL